MKTSDVYPSKYVSAEDLDGEKLVTIEKTVLEDVFNTEINATVRKPIVYFKGATKGFLVNKTNWKKIARKYGHESDAWVGQKVILTVIEVKAFGDIVQAIRVKIPNGK